MTDESRKNFHGSINYAKLNLKRPADTCARVGSVNVMGLGDYSMRIRLDPEAAREPEYFTATGLSGFIQSQNGSICRIYRSTYRAG